MFNFVFIYTKLHYVQQHPCHACSSMIGSNCGGLLGGSVVHLFTHMDTPLLNWHRTTSMLPCLQGLFWSTICGNFNFPTFPFKYYGLTPTHVMNSPNHHMTVRCKSEPHRINDTIKLANSTICTAKVN